MALQVVRERGKNEAGVPQLHLTYEMPVEEANMLAGTFIDHDAYDFLVQFDADLYKPNGEPLMKFRKKVLPGALCEQAYKALRTIHSTPTNRGMSSGKMDGATGGYPKKSDGTVSKTWLSSATLAGREAVLDSSEAVVTSTVSVTDIIREGKVGIRYAGGGHSWEVFDGRVETVDGKPFGEEPVYIDGKPLNRDGTLSKTTRMYDRQVLDQSSGIIGSFDRYARFPYCRLTAFNLDDKRNPFNEAIPFVQAVDEIFRGNLPDRYENQKTKVDGTVADWVIPGTAFTTITVNKNYRTAVHKDAGDLKEGFGVMSAIEGGSEYRGAYLVFPQFRVAVDMRTTDVCMADVHEWHGNTAIVGKKGSFERISCVFYYRGNMEKCGTPEQELKWAQNRKLGDPLWKYDRFHPGPDGAIGAAGRIEEGEEE